MEAIFEKLKNCFHLLVYSIIITILSCPISCKICPQVNMKMNFKPDLVDEVDSCKLIKHEKCGHRPSHRPMLFEHKWADLQQVP